jgi:hypothetical protein
MPGTFRSMLRRFRHTGAMVLGWILLVGGVILVPLPGPGMLALVAGIALLAPHYVWARRILDPMKVRAVLGAKRGVATPLRIAMSTAGGLWLLGLGAIWLFSPEIPVVDIVGVQIGPKLPGGRAAGIGLVTSGIVGLLLLAYSVWRWYPGRTGGSPR